jgi:hypothetical protein
LIAAYKWQCEARETAWHPLLPVEEQSTRVHDWMATLA